MKDLLQKKFVDYYFKRKNMDLCNFEMRIQSKERK